MTLKSLDADGQPQSDRRSPQSRPTTPLVLHVQAASTSASSPGRRRSSVSSACSYNLRRFSSLQEPRSPSAPAFSHPHPQEWIEEESEEDHEKRVQESKRRRKMAKLARTLGENVPPELVFREKQEQLKQQRRRSRSVGTLAALEPALKQSLASVPTSTAVPTPRPAPEPVFRPSPASVSRPNTADAYFSRSSEDTLVVSDDDSSSLGSNKKSKFFSPLGRTTSHQPPSQPLGKLKQKWAATRPSLDDSSHSHPQQRGDEEVFCGRRREKEWSGEWNTDDMERVRNALRGLKSR
jgi:hypothetical protein